VGSNKTDKRLIARVQQGEKAAFDALVLKYRSRIVNLVSGFVHNQSDVLDVTQEVFLKAYRALPNFRGDSTFYTWLYRIAVNAAKNHLIVQVRRSSESEQDIAEIEQIEGNRALKEYATPEHMLLKDEIQITVITIIEKLPEDLRMAVTLRELEGLSYEEIAVVMECPIGTVRSRIFRAREAINKKLKPLLKE